MTPDRAVAEPAVPCITLVDPVVSHGERLLEALADRGPFAAIKALVEALRDLPGAGWRSVAKALIEEGERFSRTPSGARWCRLLGNSQLVHNGWVLWNHTNADFYVRNAPPLAGDHPAALLQETLRQIARTDLEALVKQLSDVTMAIDAQAHGARSHVAQGADPDADAERS